MAEPQLYRLVVPKGETADGTPEYRVECDTEAGCKVSQAAMGYWWFPLLEPDALPYQCGEPWRVKRDNWIGKWIRQNEETN